MIPGVVATQRVVAAAGPATARPAYVAVDGGVSTSAAFTAPMPAGWTAGQLAVLHVARGSTAPATPSGWTVVGSTLTSSSGNSTLFWRILQLGDTGPALDAGTNTVAVVWTFAADTFNPSSPLVEIATNSSSGGISANPNVGASSSVAPGEHYIMQFHQTYNAFNSVSSYPYTAAQQHRGQGSSPAYVANRGCGQNFDGGVSAASQFTISAGAFWTSRKIAIIGLGFVP